MITTVTGKNQDTVPADIATLADELRGQGVAQKSRAGSAVDRLIQERTREANADSPDA